jgi:hypothetical protein
MPDPFWYIAARWGRSAYWNCLIVFTILAGRWQQFTRSEFVIIFLCIYNDYLEWEWSYLASCECITWGYIKGARLNNLAQPPSSTVRGFVNKGEFCFNWTSSKRTRGNPPFQCCHTQFLCLNSALCLILTSYKLFTDFCMKRESVGVSMCVCVCVCVCL